MLDPNEIAQLVALLERREASLWHGCGLAAFAGYLHAGGLVPRAELERTGNGRSPGPGDALDRSRGGWESIAVTLDDRAGAFARGASLTPGADGPITLQLAPATLAGAMTIDVATRSLRAPDFDETHDLLREPSLLERAFAGESGAELLSGPRLGAALDLPRASTIEIALRVRRPIPMLRVIAAWVDPVTVEREGAELQLIDVVEGLAELGSIPLRVRRRTAIEPDRATIWRDLVHLLADGEKPLVEVWRRTDASPAFRDWANRLRAVGLDWLFARLCSELYRGTLLPLSAGAASRVQRPVPVGVGADDGATAAGPGRRGFPARARSASVHPCGHLRRAWDGETCYACAAAFSSRWRYPADLS